MITDTRQSLYRSQRSVAEQRTALLSGDVPVAVYGLGKMGLPLAAVFADVTGNVIGADVDEAVVAALNGGACHVVREPGLPELVADVVDRAEFRAVSEPSVAAEQAAVHVLIVPTLIDDRHVPDVTILESVARDVGAGLSPGDVVIVESTVPPGTCTDRILPILEQTSGLARGAFGLAFCPERTSSGRALADIRGAYPKVVGGVDDESTRVATLIYEQLNSSGVIAVGDTTTAEAVKVFEGLYRDVNIALANELARFADELGIDVNEAIEVANTQPFCDIHTPGPGVGGHCIPYYPYFLIEPYETPAPLLRTARAVNDGMPSFTVRTLADQLGAEGGSLEGARVLILGLTYRPGVKETRASPAASIAEQLVEARAEVFAVDPLLDDFEPFPVTSLELADIYRQPFDAVLSVTPHEEFDDIRWSDIETDRARLTVIDCRQSLDLGDTDHRVYTIGSGA